MKKAAESQSPDPRCLALVEQAAEDIRPDGDDMADWYAGYCRQHAERIAFDVALAQRFAGNGARILDLAAVPLLLLAALHTDGRDVEGVDIDPSRFAGAIERLGLTVHASDIETEPLPFADGSFDVVVFNEIFEHLRIDPIRTMAEIRRVLAPGGVLLLSTPNGLSLVGLIRILLKRRTGPPIYQQYEKLHTLGHMGHVREYSVREVTDFLTRAGFTVDSVTYRGRFAKPLRNALCRLFPALRPKFSLIARKG